MAEPVAAATSSTRSAAATTSPARRLRMVAGGAFAADPLRTLRVVRLACELRFAVDPATAPAARAHAGDLDARRPRARVRRAQADRRRPTRRSRACTLMEDLGLDRRRAARARRAARRGAEPLPPPRRPRAHHRGSRAGRGARARSRGDRRRRARRNGRRALLREPLADGLTRGGGLRLGALLHDAAKPQTRVELPDGRVGFPGHDVVGRGPVARRAHPPARQRAPARARRRARAPPPAPRLPRPRGAARRAAPCIAT